MSKLKLLERDLIDDLKWDHCIASCAQKMIYGHSWYLDKVADQWMGIVKGDYEAVMPLTYRSKMGIAYLHQPFFCQQLGVFSANPDDPIEEFIDAIPDKFKYWDIKLNYLNKSKKDLSTNMTHILSLKESYEEIQKNYSKNLKRNLKKGNESGIVISEHNSFRVASDLFRNDKGKKVRAYGRIDYNHLHDLLRHLRNKQLLYYRVAFNKKRVAIAAIAVAGNRNYRSFLFSGNSDEGKECAAIPLLLDRYIKLHAETNSIFDFNGSNDENLARFYKGFGSQETLYLSLRRNLLPQAIKWIKP